MVSAIVLVLNSQSTTTLIGEGSKSGKVLLIPDLDGQHHGYLEIHRIINKSKTSVLDKIQLDSLNLMKNGGIEVDGSLTPPGFITIKITQKKRHIMEKKIKLPRPYLFWSLTAGSILLLLSLGFGIIMGNESNIDSSIVTEEQSNRMEEKPPITHQIVLQENDESTKPGSRTTETADSNSLKPLNEEDKEISEENKGEIQPGTSLNTSDAPVQNIPPEPNPLPAPDPGGVLFQPNSPVLTDLAKSKLDKITITLSAGTMTLKMVRGHCALYGTEEGRQILSKERAQAVTDYLLNRGANLSDETEIIGVGATMPLTRDQNLQELNRRVEIHYYYD